MATLPTEEYKKFLATAVDGYQLALEQNAGGVLDYLLSRGIHWETARYFNLGIVTSENALAGHEQYVGRLAIPYMTKTCPTGIRFKSITGVQPKVLSQEGWQSRPYNAMDVLALTPVLLVCEGEPDTWTARQMGFPAVGMVAGDDPSKYAPLFRYRTPIVVMHNDEKGSVKVGKQFGARFVQAVPHARPVLMPEGHDLNSFYVAEGAERVTIYMNL